MRLETAQGVLAPFPVSMNNNPEAARRARAARPEDGAEIHFLERVRRRLPGDLEVARALADGFTRVGRFDEGLSLDLEIVRLHPEEALGWYNLACSQALCGRPEEALASLEKAVDRGYGDANWMREDEDLASLRATAGFRRLVARVAAGGVA